MSTSPMEQALRAADEALAAECSCDQQSMEPETESKNETTATTTATGTSTEAQVDTDPDDMAAAFFAAQAKKQEAESRLPTREWAQLFPDLRLQAGQITNAKESEMRSLIKEQLVAKLHQEYTKALTKN